MIIVDGGKIELSGTDITLQKELSFLLVTFQSRMMSQGHNYRYAESVIDTSVTESRIYTLSYLRSESRMYADAERIGRARREIGVCTIEV